jgi:GLPGLI family protein
MNMKKRLSTAIFLLFAIVANAQQKEGKVIYEYTNKYKGKITTTTMSSDGSVSRAAAAFIPPPPKKYELLFGNQKMLWSKIDVELPTGNSGGMVSMSGAGAIGGDSEDIVFCDFATGEGIRQKDVFDKLYLVQQPISKLNWKMSGETKKILDRFCHKAVATTVNKRMQITMKDGQMAKEEVSDTITTTAWYSTEIPVSAAPEVYGQLPGLVLELEIDNAYTTSTYIAVEVSNKVNLATVKAPTKGKKIAADAMKKEMENLMKQALDNGPSKWLKPVQGSN